MAEAFLNASGKNLFEAESAGIEPGKLNPFVVEAMRDEGIDISGNSTKSVADMIAKNKTYDFVITVCDPKASEMCPVFPGGTKRLHWEFEDPSSFAGSDDEQYAFARIVRDKIKDRVLMFIKELK
jgi:arsenate reductase